MLHVKVSYLTGNQIKVLVTYQFLWLQNANIKQILLLKNNLIEIHKNTFSGLLIFNMSFPENQSILFFIYFSNISNEPDIFHGCTS